MSQTEPVHLLARRGVDPDGISRTRYVWTRCGIRAGLRASERLPENITAAAGNVTCPVCADPPSWADAGIPT